MASLVGRREELSRLNQALSIVDSGGGTIVTITGEPGIGKSRLLDHLAAIAAEEHRSVLVGRATEFERHEPFGVLIDALDEAVELTLTADPGLIDEHAKSLLRPVLPALRRHGDGAGSIVPSAGDRVGRYRELRRLLRELAAFGPIVLLLDDVHWIDQSSAELLDYLLRHPALARVLIVLAYRPAQLPTLLAHSIDRARANGRVDEIELAPLSMGEATELVTPILSNSELRLAYAASGGNPLYLEAVARRHAKRSAPAGYADLSLPALLGADLAAISADGLHLLQAAAVLGDPFDVLHAAALAGLESPAAGLALDELAERDLVRPTVSVRVFQFRHPLVRSAAYSRAKRAWRAEHRAVVGETGRVGHVSQYA